MTFVVPAADPTLPSGCARPEPRADRVHGERTATTRRYLMCPPTYFAVDYAINPWMDPTAPVDRALAHRQWDALRRTYLTLGHRVELLDPLPGLPDMVFAANGMLSHRGRAVGARFAYPQRAAEAAAHRAWLTAQGRPAPQTAAVSEGEGDFLHVGDALLAGFGFRTVRAAHAEVARLLQVEVVSLELVDPAFYHLDTCLGVLSDVPGAAEIAYLPAAFSPRSQAVLAERYPDAVIAGRADALAFGLNLVSDGRTVVLPTGAPALAGQLVERGFEVIPVQTSALIRAGGSVKCCTQEVRL